MIIDAFDLGFEDEQPAPSPRKFEAMPEGEHEMSIVAASVGVVPWKKTDANPMGECLRLRLSGGNDYAFVFADIPRDRPALFRALAAALGLQAGPDGKVSIGKPEGLVGREVRVELGHYVTKNNETRASVKRWLPAAPPPAKPATAKTRTPTAKVAPAARATSIEDDDLIPF